ncbi:cytochrome P450 [Xylaria cubensis]|nr:cytochrome P450 [Xylaria cubensis]
MSTYLAGVILVIAVSALLWKCIVYPFFFSPLASIPAAHPLAHFTSLWIQWQRLHGKDFQSVSKAFETHGPYVRLGPRELALNDIEAVRCVWGVGAADFDKHPSYTYWAMQGTSNTFTSVLKSDHRRRHRRIRGVHKHSYIASSPHVRAIMSTLMVDRLTPLLAQIAMSSDGTADMLPIAQSIVLDCTSAFAFGVPLSLNFLSDAAARQHWFNLFNAGFPNDQSSFWLREHPELTKILCFLGIPVVSNQVAKARREFENWALPKVDAAEEVLQKHNEGHTLAAGKLPVLCDAVWSDLAMTHSETAKVRFSMSPAQRRELASECLDHIAFTTEAFATVLTYMVYEISHHQEIQNELRAELRSANNPLLGNAANQTEVPSSDTLEQLPLMSAVIKESLRLRNTSPSADPRVTPAHCTSRIGIIPNVPPKTRVCSYGWCLHRNPDVYSNPLDWNPKRWLRGGCDDVALAKKWFFAFGAGSRNCIGQNIALELMRMSLATIYTSNATFVADETQYPGANRPMNPDLSDRLFIKFEKLS